MKKAIAKLTNAQLNLLNTTGELTINMPPDVSSLIIKVDLSKQRKIINDVNRTIDDLAETVRKCKIK